MALHVVLHLTLVEVINKVCLSGALHDALKRIEENAEELLHIVLCERISVGPTEALRQVLGLNRAQVAQLQTGKELLELKGN